MIKKTLPRKNPNNPQIKSYVDAVQKGQLSQHVVPNESGWSVKKGDSSEVTKTFQRQQEAIDYAKELAKKQKSELFVHGKNGRIRKRMSPR